MDRALLDVDIARRAIGWREGRRLPVVPLRDEDLPVSGVHSTPDAHVRATRDELTIQLDVLPSAREPRVRYEPEGVIHVSYRIGNRRAYRRFDFGGVYDARAAHAWLSYGVLTIRVPRSAPRLAKTRPPLEPSGWMHPTHPTRRRAQSRPSGERSGHSGRTLLFWRFE